MGIRALVLLGALVHPSTIQDPTFPPQAPGGGRVLALLHVDAGTVARVDILDGTAPFAEPTRDALLRWRFPPNGGRHRIPVLVVYSDPNRFGGPGASALEPVDPAAKGVPAPEEIVAPEYPVRGSGGAAVVLALRIGPSGSVEDATPIQSRGDFTDAAIAALREWRFAPERRSTEMLAVFVFRPPVLPPLPAR